MGRRKKRSQNDDSFDEELAIEIYKKRKSFERPENKGLETVFEGEAGKENEAEEKSENSPKTKVRAPRASKAKLQPKLRMINTQAYYIEDSDKSVHVGVSPGVQVGVKYMFSIEPDGKAKGKANGKGKEN